MPYYNSGLEKVLLVGAGKKRPKKQTNSQTFLSFPKEIQKFLPQIAALSTVTLFTLQHSPFLLQIQVYQLPYCFCKHC